MPGSGGSAQRACGASRFRLLECAARGAAQLRGGKGTRRFGFVTGDAHKEFAVTLKRAIFSQKGSDLLFAPLHRHEDHAHGEGGCGCEDDCANKSEHWTIPCVLPDPPG